MPYSRASANRAFGYALLASIVLHAFLLGVEWPQFSAALRKPVEALAPLVARLVEPAPAPPPALEEEKQEPKAKPAPVRPAKPLPQPVPHAEPERVVEAPPAVTAPAPAPAPVAAPAPAPPAASSPAPLARAAPPAPANNAPSLIAQYRAGLLAAGKRYKGRYPPVARENTWEGRVDVRIAVARDGSIALRVQSSSGYAVLDRDAVEIFRKASAEVPLPAALRGHEFSVDLPVRYDLKDQASG